MKELAYYTCYFGGTNNYSRIIPPLPSTKNDCYYFTNDKNIYNELLDTKWKVVFLDIPIHNCTIKDAMESKKIRCCPHEYEELKNYDYLCWFDSKLQVFENKIEELMTDLSNDDNKIIVLSKHPYYDRFTSVWDEFHLAMGYDRYKQQKEQNEKYIKDKINRGFSEKINIHFCAGWNIKKMCKKTEEFGEMWYQQIQECGVEDQISLQFIQQIYIENIIPTEYQYAWKYFYE